MIETRPNIKVPDEVYEWLIEAHQGLDDGQSAALNARLILILMNHIGDRGVLRAAIDAAKQPGGHS